MAEGEIGCRNHPAFVIPAKAGIQLSGIALRLDPRLRGGDEDGWVAPYLNRLPKIPRMSWPPNLPAT